MSEAIEGTVMEGPRFCPSYSLGLLLILGVLRVQRVDGKRVEWCTGGQGLFTFHRPKFRHTVTANRKGD